MMKKRPYFRPVLLGFLGMYIVAMTLASNWKHAQYSETVHKWVTDTSISIEETLGERTAWLAEEFTKDQQRFIKMLVSGMGTNTLDRYSLMSSAIYDKNGNLIAQSETIAGSLYVNEETKESHYYYYGLKDYLSEKEIKELATYRREIYKSAEGSEAEVPPPKYHIPIFVDESTGELAKITVLEAKWEDIKVRHEDDAGQHYWNRYKLVEQTPVWEWTNPNVSSDAKLTDIAVYTMNFGFPGLEHGMRQWEKWQESGRLHEYPENINQYEGMYHFSLYTHILYDPMDEESLVLVMNIDTRPWLATMDSLKMFYLGSFLFVVVCTLIVLYFMEKAYKRQEALEETRKDFTNAIAHELKTPLGVIRGFAENLQENTKEEKREYYIRQIIGQTEVMDGLVEEMNYVSKLESDKLVLKREDVDLLKLIEKQVEKLNPLIEEKEVTVDYKIQGAFVVSADSSYMEKVIWNLLANACEYNEKGGVIKISVGSGWCIIENTGKQIAQEELPHVCDMFYSGDKSRTSERKHMGLGLYLVKKILTLHNLNFDIRNSSLGVKATITR